MLKQEAYHEEQKRMQSEKLKQKTNYNAHGAEKLRIQELSWYERWIRVHLQLISQIPVPCERLI